MPRLFLFAIGGSGARVLKSLTMLLASGVKSINRESFEIVPILIDPHKTNEDLKRTERLLTNYQAIVNEIGLNNGFFSTQITTLENIGESKSRGSSFTFNLQEVANKRFKDYIDYNQLEEGTGKANKSLVDVLFSGKSVDKMHRQIDLLDVEMDIGFVGNPNIGSVVLNQFKDSEEFKEFASNFNENDRVFIVSSIFGGTGAAGFPTILKNIRGAMNNPKIDGKGFLRDAKIGALTVLPYFNVEISENSPIQKSDFIAKTKSALHYYQSNVTGNDSINALYYIGDSFSSSPYKNDPGEGGQKNNAHLIEMASALAVFDFMNIPDNALVSEGGKAINPIYKEYSIKNDNRDLHFSDLEDLSQRLLTRNLSQLYLFKLYLNNSFFNSLEVEPWSINEPQIDSTITNDIFFRTYLSEYMGAYEEWLNEMALNSRSFKPFNFRATLESFISASQVRHDPN